MYKNISLLLFFIVWLMLGAIGCKSAPTATSADIPLVHSTLAYSLSVIDEQTINIPKANVLFNSNELFQITLEGNQYTAVKRYVSATGNKCIRFVRDNDITELLVEQDGDRKLTSCEREGVWILINPLVANANIEGTALK